MMDPMAIAEDFAPQSIQPITIINPKTGTPQEFVIRRHVSLPGYLEADARVSKRIDLLTKLKKLSVIVPADVVEKHPNEFKDAVIRQKEGDFEIFLTNDKEVKMATTLEVSMVDPELTWAQAVIWTRIAGPLTVALMKKLDEINTEVAIQDAKNA